MSQRPLPQNLEAERSVLGAILVDSAALYAVGSTLTPEHFYRESHRRIYASLIRLAERGVPAEFVTLCDDLRKHGDLDECGGPVYVAGLADGMPRSVNIEHYARIVRENANLRALIDVSAKVTASAYAANDDARAVLDEAERELLTLSQDTQTGDLVFIERVLPDTMALLEQLSQTRRTVTGLSTGISELDAKTRGLHPGNLIVLGGRPGEGKSALALQLALHVAKSVPVAFFSMEMQRDEILTRAIAQIARVDHHAMMQGRLSNDDQSAVGSARLLLEQLPLAIDDTSAQTPFQIRSKAKKMQARSGVGFVVVDYLQLLQRPRTAASREEAVGDNTWGLKVLAGELKVPVLALSQLNRNNQAREQKRPTLSDLRESGAIEQHANVVLLIYQLPAEGNGVVADSPSVELLIAKQRNGPSQWAIDLQFRGPSMRFEEPERRYA